MYFIIALLIGDNYIDTFRPVADVQINAAGQAVKIFYSRKRVKTTFVLADKTGGTWNTTPASTDDIVKQGLYGADVPDVPSAQADINHIFLEWKKGSDKIASLPSPLTFADTDEVYTAYWTDQAAYKVKYWFEKDGDTDPALAASYEQKPDFDPEAPGKYADVSLTGKIGTTAVENPVLAVPDASYEKRSDAPATAVTVTKDGNAVLNVYFAKKRVNLVFKTDDTDPTHGSFTPNPYVPVNVKYGTAREALKDSSGNSLPTPAPAGIYSYSWTKDGAEVTLPASFTQDATYVVVWIADRVNYTISYYFEKVDSTDKDDYSNYVLDSSYDKSQTGKVGETPVVPQLETVPTGFEYKGKEARPAIIKDDTIKVYYSRKRTNIIFTLADKTGGTWNTTGTSADITVTGLYDADLPAASRPSAVADNLHLFDKWKKGDTDYGTSLPAAIKFTDADQTFTAYWTDQAAYKVKYWFEKDGDTDPALAASYEQKPDFDPEAPGKYADVSLTGKIGDAATENPAKSAPTGFDTKHTEAVNIKKDGTAVLNIYFPYKRYTINFTIDKTHGTWNKSGDAYSTTGKYNTSVTDVPAGTADDGYEAKWTLTSTGAAATIPQKFTADGAYKMVFEAQTRNYTIEYLLEKTTSTDSSVDSNYESSSDTKYATKSGSATVGTSVASQAPAADTGFALRDPAVTTFTVAASGNAFKVYYKRNRVTMTYNLTTTTGGGWNKAGNQFVKTNGVYGATIAAADKPVANPASGYAAVWKKGGTEGTLPATYPAASETWDLSFKAGSVNYTTKYWFEKSTSTDASVAANYEQNTTNYPDKSASGTVAGSVTATEFPSSTPGFERRDSTIPSITLVADATQNIINVYYKRKMVTMTYILASSTGGTWTDGTSPSTKTGRYGSATSTPTGTASAGYTATWKKVVSTTETAGTPPTAYPLEGETWKLYFEPQKRSYKIEYLFETTAGAAYEKNTATYADKTGEADVGSTVTDSNPPAAPAGFVRQTVGSITVGADATANVLQVKYNRNRVTVTYTLASSTGGTWTGGSSPVTKIGIYGATIASKPTATASAGYTAVWKKVVNTTETEGTPSDAYPAADENWKLYFEPQDVGYTIKYWFEKTTSTDASVTYEQNTATYPNKSGTGKVGASATDSSPHSSPTGFKTHETITPITLTATASSNIINVYYKRQIITMTYKIVSSTGGKWSDNTTADKSLSGRYGAATSTPAYTASAGYTAQWKKTGATQAGTPPTTYPVSGETWELSFIAGAASYSIEYYKENPADVGNYVKDSTMTESKTDGTVGQPTAITSAYATSKMPAGYQLKASNPVVNVTSLNPSGDVVKIYYDLKQIKYTYEVNGGTWSGSETGIRQGKYLTTFTKPVNPTRTDYAFQGYVIKGTSTAFDKSQYTDTSDVTVTAQWKSTIANYKIKYHKENTSGSYIEDTSMAETKSGTIGQSTGVTTEYATAKLPSSGIYKLRTSNSVVNATIAEDGTAVANVYFELITVTYTYNASGGTWSGSETGIRSGKYGQSFTPPVPTRTNYEFKGYKLGSGTVFNKTTFDTTTDQKAYAQWETTVASYKIQYYKEDAAGEYQLDNSMTQTLSGTIGQSTGVTSTSVASVVNGQTGYKLRDSNAITNATITSDGTAVAKVYLELKEYTYTFSANGGAWSGSEDGIRTGKYLKALSVPANPTRSGYQFAGWKSGGTDFTATTFNKAENLTITAQWTPVSEAEIEITTQSDITVTIDNNAKTLTVSPPSGSQGLTWTYTWYNDLMVQEATGAVYNFASKTKGKYTMTVVAHAEDEIDRITTFNLTIKQ